MNKEESSLLQTSQAWLHSEMAFIQLRLCGYLNIYQTPSIKWKRSVLRTLLSQPTHRVAKHTRVKPDLFLKKNLLSNSQFKPGCWWPRFTWFMWAIRSNWTWRLVSYLPEEKLNWLPPHYSKRALLEWLYGERSQNLQLCLYWDREAGQTTS